MRTQAKPHTKTGQTSQTGIFKTVKQALAQYRLGDLLLAKGVLTQDQLSRALARHQSEGRQLGKVLVAENIVSRPRLYRTLVQQWALRCLAAFLSLSLLFSVSGIKQAKAQTIQDIPPQLRLAAAANAAFSPVRQYPALFGSKEQLSRNLAPFTKWSGMFARFDQAVSTTRGQHVVAEWRTRLERFENLPLRAMAAAINSYVNEQPYILDNRNWGKSDYWATPVEFFSRGGDCEDFAIAKYASLRALGVPEERLRVAIVHDKKKDIPHAVLIVYTDTEALILDNQSDNVVDSANINRYRPIFSINRQAWWLHTADKTVLASADKMGPAAE